jgi:hypothetical protein
LKGIPMLPLSRRRALLSASVLVPAALLAACGTPTPATPVTPPINPIATDTNLIAGGISAVIASITASAGSTPSANVVKLQGYLTTIQTDAAQVAAATATPATSVISEIAQTVQAIAPIALSLIPGGSALVDVVNAALSLLPSLLSAVGLSAATAGAKAPIYTPDQARLILAAHAQK